jgi:WD40 repeat protein
MNHHALRLTPSNSPFYKTNNTSPRSPTKAPKPDEPGLQLRHVIGTTTASSTAFDSLPSSRLFAHTAGACAVLAEVEATTEGLSAKQRFYRARPTPTGNSRDGLTPTPSEPRHRALGFVREQSVGGSPLASSGRDWSDSPSGRSTTAKDRVKAATSVALSPNGKWLALGETGYKPRIAIFCLADDASDSPVTIISEHSFGVHALRFSPDSKYLASLGTVNDGFIYIWSIDDKTGAAGLHASNKLTTLTNAVAWIGDAVVTAGLRFIKVWRPDDEANSDIRSPELLSTPAFTPKSRVDTRSSDYGNSILTPRHKTLAGKNVLLGDLLECNFVTLVPISNNEAIVCAETGEICLLNDKDKAQSLMLITTATFTISAARIDEDGSLQVMGQEGCLKTLSPAEYAQPSRPPSRSRRQTVLPARPTSSGSPLTIATAALGLIVVELDSERVLTLRNQEDQSFTQLAAHREAVQGVKLCRSNALPLARFLTYSATGLIQFWDTDGVLDAFLNVPVPPAPAAQSTANELKSVAPFVGGTCIATGDKYGVLSIADVRTKALVTQVRAHSAEIMDLCAFQIEDVDFVATAGRDRMSQLFVWKNGQLSLLQTMDEHAGAVTGVLFDQDERRLITHSSDRSVVVRETMFREEGNVESLAFVMLRAITVKASPTSMCLTGDSELLIATVDRCIGKYKIKNGQCTSSFKCSDADGGEAAVMYKVLYAPSLNGSPAIAGVASSDKSVRMYTEYGSLIARDWGHTEGITDVALLPADDNTSTSRLVTVAADSTIFIWDTVLPSPTQAADPGGLGIVLEANSNSNDIALNPPLRKIISHTDLSRHRRLKSASESEPVSPTPTIGPRSPQRLRKKPSRISTAGTPRLEPAFLSVFPPDSPSRRDSIRHRSPSPPIPRTTEPKPRAAQQTTHKRRTSLSTTLARFNKSSDNVSTSSKASNKPTTTTSSPTATLTAASVSSLATSTDSVSRSLRSYRKRLAAQHMANGNAVLLPPNALRELERELKLTLAALGGLRAEGDEVELAKGSKTSKKDEGLERTRTGSGATVGEDVIERKRTESNATVEDGLTETMSTGNGGRDAGVQSLDMDAVVGALGEVGLDGN